MERFEAQNAEDEVVSCSVKASLPWHKSTVEIDGASHYVSGSRHICSNSQDQHRESQGYFCMIRKWRLTGCSVVLG